MTIAVEMKKITKIYPNGTIANKDVNFTLNKGEIHALLGENGAGKSTLMHILFGLSEKTYGDIFVYGEKVEIKSPIDALSKKIGMVHQHFMLVPSMTIAENLILGVEKSKKGIINLKEKIEMANSFCKKYNFDIDCSKKVQDVTVAVRQKVEILKALYRGAEILILDEPTAVLTPQETKELFKEIKILKNEGKSIIFISHKLNEVKELCDKMTIMRNGKKIGDFTTADLTEEEISEKMVGREVVLTFEKEEIDAGDRILKVRNLDYTNELNKKMLNNISFDLRKGEILGIAGVDGNGQKELVETIIGLNKKYTGDIFIKNKLTKKLTIKQIRNLGLRFIPEDRMKDGCIGNETIFNNIVYERLENGEFFKNKFLIDWKKVREITKDKINEYKIKCQNENSHINSLSGGNIQKVIVAREFDNNPELIIINQPTRGIDVGAGELVRKKIIDLRTLGSGVLLISADLNEILEVADRLIVLNKGEITAFIEKPKEISELELGYYMLGVKKQKDVSGVIYE